MTFKEEQKFRSVWIYFILAVTSIVILWLARNDYDLKPLHLTIVLSPILIVIYLVEFSKLFTSISKDGISYRFKPYQRSTKFIPWDEIKSIEVKKYNPIRDYGGWGVRVGKAGKGYNTRGNMGIFIQTSDQKTLMLGTQQPEAVQRVIKHYFSTN